MCDKNLFFPPLSNLVQTMKAFIEANFKMVDLNGDGIISGEEFRYNCITRIAVDDIKVVDEAFNRLMNVSPATHESRVLLWQPPPPPPLPLPTAHRMMRCRHGSGSACPGL